MFACENIKDSLTAIGNPVAAAKRQTEIDKLKKVFFAQGGKILVSPEFEIVDRPISKTNGSGIKCGTAKNPPRTAHLKKAYNKINQRELKRLKKINSKSEGLAVDSVDLAMLLNRPVESLMLPSRRKQTYFGRDVKPIQLDPPMWKLEDVIKWVEALEERIGL